MPFATDTTQAHLNLFVLWHNVRVYERGKRMGFCLPIPKINAGSKADCQSARFVVEGPPQSGHGNCSLD
jgi:hypothetical protein